MAKPNNPAAVVPKGHAERLQFPKLIAKNPNYFGTFPEVKLPPIFPLSNDTTFEELTCVGYNPDQGILEAVIQVKQATGYLGNECTPGSCEYIRCAQQSEKPLSYSASISYTPPNSEDCDEPVVRSTWPKRNSATATTSNSSASPRT